MSEISFPRIEAPFTPEQVANINEFQRSGCMHPFTCLNSHEEGGDLAAVEEGLQCPVCDYRQNWVHSFMADGTAVQYYRATLDDPPSTQAE